MTLQKKSMNATTSNGGQSPLLVSEKITFPLKFLFIQIDSLYQRA